MLKTLTVTNFALIEHAIVDFTAGLNILTGETGAGKSILIDALNTVLGSRAATEAIRSGSDYFRVEALFDLAAESSLSELLAEQGIPVDDSTLIISRHVSRQGKNSILINGCHVTLGMLRQIGGELVDMHGQHENQSLLRPETHQGLLDSFDPVIKEQLDAYRDVYQTWNKLCGEIGSTISDSRERAQRLDMLQWQTREIAAAALKPGEEEALAQDIKVLANAEKIINSVGRAYALLSEGGKGTIGIVSALAEVKKELENAARFDHSLEEQLNSVSDALYQLEESTTELRDYSENVEFNPQRLACLQERMDTIHKLKKKYGSTIDEVLEYYRQATEDLAAITNYEERLAELESKRTTLEKELAAYSGRLDTLRRNAAESVAGMICCHLAQLGMPKAKLVFDVKNIDRYTSTGSNETAILFSANPGEEPRLLQKVASGGELSRLALAIKTVAASRYSVGTMVFDEIDVGIGGQTAQMVAEKVALVSRGRQVLCITHLPQIAAMADLHIYVEKRLSGERTLTAVRILKESDHLTEVARMISGDNITRAAMENAAEMVASSETKKRNMEK